MFSRVLLNNHQLPAGEIIAAGNCRFNVVNTFNYPLQGHPLKNPFGNLGKAIENLQYTDRIKYNALLKELFYRHVLDSEVEDYRNRLLMTIPNSDRQGKFVFCGLISQAFMEFAFKFKIQKFGTPFTLDIAGNKVSVFYVFHPSPRSGKKNTHSGISVSAWEDGKNKKIIDRLIGFLE